MSALKASATPDSKSRRESSSFRATIFAKKFMSKFYSLLPKLWLECTWCRNAHRLALDPWRTVPALHNRQRGRALRLRTAHRLLLAPKRLTLVDQGLQFGQGAAGVDGLPGQIDTPGKIRGQAGGDEGGGGV